ncbi:MAG TPA: M15 family metallopeptidase [Kofleriaceae bacterium]|jgi:poly-gamma-glutamate synthesis protein (capsule biosynthesis protein)|nr:M15 family metallopeptidase [Kofleriaceae bacterium]
MSTPPAVFDAEVLPLGIDLCADMNGRSWRDDPRCPRFDELALVRMNHHGFDGAIHRGELVIAAAVADDVVAAFARIFAAGFPIELMARVDRFDADDARSMAANNCSAFNFRVAPSGKLSQHSFGTAIDINPVQNPMVIGDRVYPDAGAAYLDRGDLRAGMIVRPGPVVDAFAAIGWGWGGDWTRILDYHHFSLTGL